MSEKYHLSAAAPQGEIYYPGYSGFSPGRKQKAAVYLYRGGAAGAESAVYDAPCVPHRQGGRGAPASDGKADGYGQLCAESLSPLLRRNYA